MLIAGLLLAGLLAPCRYLVHSLLLLQLIAPATSSYCELAAKLMLVTIIAPILVI